MGLAVTPAAWNSKASGPKRPEPFCKALGSRPRRRWGRAPRGCWSFLSFLDEEAGSAWACPCTPAGRRPGGGPGLPRHRAPKAGAQPAGAPHPSLEQRAGAGAGVSRPAASAALRCHGAAVAAAQTSFWALFPGHLELAARRPSPAPPGPHPQLGAARRLRALQALLLRAPWRVSPLVPHSVGTGPPTAHTGMWAHSPHTCTQHMHACGHTARMCTQHIHACATLIAHMLTATHSTV